ncbi:hypothetical protein IscW_ISCW024839 [Ixodes scapularis]|uniref:Uncharacterized protein n=1 Tax=Ixodes scapularis TaxID=6945 RepID=B7QJU0_IXOSC|nr:hypothetical protein IscW_ISCW024839 [Ixodes scapularis]|eukprot:XP_002415447.1 hypothetical protein IscW_ISCW024839 [Ixodes scapularis]
MTCRICQSYFVQSGIKFLRHRKRMPSRQFDNEQIQRPYIFGRLLKIVTDHHVSFFYYFCSLTNL